MPHRQWGPAVILMYEGIASGTSWPKMASDALGLASGG
jgi:hypothetical protein